MLIEPLMPPDDIPTDPVMLNEACPEPILTNAQLTFGFRLLRALTSRKAWAVGLFMPNPPSRNDWPSMEMGGKYRGAADVARATCQISNPSGLGFGEPLARFPMPAADSREMVGLPVDCSVVSTRGPLYVRNRNGAIRRESASLLAIAAKTPLRLVSRRAVVWGWTGGFERSALVPWREKQVPFPLLALWARVKITHQDPCCVDDDFLAVSRTPKERGHEASEQSVE